MSDDPNAPQSPDEPPPSPFPDSSLSPPPEAPEAPASGGLWSGAQEEPPPPQPASGTGLTSGDPLGGTPPAFPPGYTSPPPPGAGGPAYAPPPAAAPALGTMVLSGWWRRVAAAVIDGLLIITVALAIMAPLGIGLFSVDSDDGTGFFALIAGFLVAMLVIAIVALAYAPVMMGATNGKTIGRMVAGIRVVRAKGEPMTIGFAALREVAVKTLLIQAVGGSFTFGLAGLLDVLWPLWDDENRALHDFVVDTRTVID